MPCGSSRVLERHVDTGRIGEYNALPMGNRQTYVSGVRKDRHRRDLDCATLQEIADDMGVSVQRVQQLENSALRKVRENFERMGIFSFEEVVG